MESMTRRCAPALLAALAFTVSAPALAETAAEQCAGNATAGDVAACERALNSAPGDIELRRHLARAHIELGDFDSAITVYEAIAASRPRDARALMDLAGSLGFVRRYTEAADILETLIRLRPTDVEAYRTAAIVYANLGRGGDAVNMTEQAANLGDTPAMYDMYQALRNGRDREHDPHGAVRWATRAAEAGHAGAMRALVPIHLNGLLSQPVDEARAIHWAERLRKLRRP